MSAMELLSWGNNITPGTYRLHSRFSHAVNYVCGNNFACLTDAFAGGGPANICLKTMAQTQDTLVIGPDFAQNGHLIIKKEVHKIYNSDIGGGRPDAALLRQLLKSGIKLFDPLSAAFVLAPARLDSFKTRFEKEYAKAFLAGADRLAAQDFEGGAKALKGLGFGLTPSGDDFIAGCLAGLFTAGHTARFNALATACKTLYSGQQTLSALTAVHAAKGMFFERLRDFCRGARAGTGLEEALRRLLEAGSTSGGDTAAGFFYTVLDKEDLHD